MQMSSTHIHNLLEKAPQHPLICIFIHFCLSERHAWEKRRLMRGSIFTPRSAWLSLTGVCVKRFTLTPLIIVMPVWLLRRQLRLNASQDFSATMKPKAQDKRRRLQPVVNMTEQKSDPLLGDDSSKGTKGRRTCKTSNGLHHVWLALSTISPAIIAFLLQVAVLSACPQINFSIP